VSFVAGGRERPIGLGGDESRSASASRETDLDVLVRALRLAAPARSQPPIWQPPLPPRITLGELRTPAESLWADGPGWMRAPLGRIDIPQECRQEPFAIDLATAHLAVVGAPGSGKTMLLRSLVLGLALAHSPRDLWCYLVDAGGQGLAPLAGLPHVAALIQARERERVRRLIRMLDAAVRERQDRLRAADAADLPAYRAAGGRDLPALLVVVDKLAVLREEFRDAYGDGTILDDLVRLARVGRPCGVHLVLSADRVGDLSYRLLSLVEARVALRQAELSDYADVLGARVSEPIPAALPGRSLWVHPDHGPLELQAALPSLEPPALDAAPGAEPGARALDGELIAELREQVAALAATWRGWPGAASCRPQPVELLPDRVPRAELAPGAARLAPADGLAAPLGRESLALTTVELRLDGDTPHALVIGGRRSGKTGALLTVLHSLIEIYSPQELELLILDSPRGGMAELRTLPHTACYARGEQGAAALALAVGELCARAASGPRRLIVIDDYTLCRERMRDQLGQSYGSDPNLLTRLCEIAQGGPQGLHLLVAANITYADDALLRALDGGRSGVVLWPGRYDGGTRLLGVGLPLSEQREADQPPGRALLIREDAQLLVQIAQA
jgi:S-DNA-T family DNA segregation ATPase FtsK/SpoIIIE